MPVADNWTDFMVSLSPIKMCSSKRWKKITALICYHQIVHAFFIFYFGARKFVLLIDKTCFWNIHSLTWIKCDFSLVAGKIVGASELQGPKNFSYRDLKSATKNFNKENKLGEGGFGAIYKVISYVCSVGKRLNHNVIIMIKNALMGKYTLGSP